MIEFDFENEFLPLMKSPAYNLCTKSQLYKHNLETFEEPVAVFCYGLQRAFLYDMEDAEQIEDCNRMPKIYPFTKDNLMKALKRIRVSKQGYMKFIHPKKLYRYEKKYIELGKLETEVLEKFARDKIKIFDIGFNSLCLLDAVATLKAFVESK